MRRSDQKFPILCFLLSVSDEKHHTYIRALQFIADVGQVKIRASWNIMLFAKN